MGKNNREEIKMGEKGRSKQGRGYRSISGDINILSPSLPQSAFLGPLGRAPPKQPQVEPMGMQGFMLGQSDFEEDFMASSFSEGCNTCPSGTCPNAHVPFCIGRRG